MTHIGFKAILPIIKAIRGSFQIATEVFYEDRRIGISMGEMETFMNSIPHIDTHVYAYELDYTMIVEFEHAEIPIN